MKHKKIFLPLIVLTALLLAVVIWYNIPVRLVNQSPDEVKRIEYYDHSNGTATVIENREAIDYIISTLSGLRFRRHFLSRGTPANYYMTIIGFDNLKSYIDIGVWADDERGVKKHGISLIPYVFHHYTAYVPTGGDEPIRELDAYLNDLLYG